jgi:hypothetical protein
MRMLVQYGPLRMGVEYTFKIGHRASNEWRLEIRLQLRGPSTPSVYPSEPRTLRHWMAVVGAGRFATKAWPARTGKVRGAGILAARGCCRMVQPAGSASRVSQPFAPPRNEDHLASRICSKNSRSAHLQGRCSISCWVNPITDSGHASSRMLLEKAGVC